MTDFVAELGARLADKWLKLLAAPGLLYITCIAVAATLRQSQATDIAFLRATLDRIASKPAASSPGVIILTTGAVLAGAVAAGLAAAVLGQLIEHAWAAQGQRWPARILKERRRHRWLKADTEVTNEIKLAAATRADVSPDLPTEGNSVSLREAIARRNGISLLSPQCPTWMGDRLYAVDQRVYDAYDLDLATAWPRLWLIMPDTVRAELKTARDAYGTAALLAGWAILYLPIAWLWWPALLIAVVIAVTAWIRGRIAVGALADLTEAAVDLYGRSLAAQLGIPTEGRLTRQAGLAITSTVRKDLETHQPAQ